MNIGINCQIDCQEISKTSKSFMNWHFYSIPDEGTAEGRKDRGGTAEGRKDRGGTEEGGKDG